MAMRQADDFDAIRGAMQTPWMPKRKGSKVDHCDHCPKAIKEVCLLDCLDELKQGQSKS